MLLALDAIPSSDWSALARQSRTASWFQTEEAYRFLASQSAALVPFGYGVHDGQSLKGVCLGYLTRYSNPFKQFFTRRAIIIGGPMLADDISIEAMNELLQAVSRDMRHKAIYVEVRNFFDYTPYRSLFEACGWQYKPHLNFRVRTDSEPAIRSRLSRSRKRNIVTSLRNGAEIVPHPTTEEVKQWYNLLHQLYRHKIRTPLFGWEFFRHLYTIPSAHFLLVRRQGKIVGGTLCMGEKNMPLYEWFVCGSPCDIKSVFPSCVATYAGLLCAVNLDSPYLDMMGAGVPNEYYGVRDFKARFGGQMVEYGRYLLVNNRPLYLLGKWGIQVMKNRRNELRISNRHEST